MGSSALAGRQSLAKGATPLTTPSFETIPLGLCQCGCGQKTSIAKRNDPRKPHIKGQYVPYIHNHHFRKPRLNLHDAGHFKLDGHYCRLIPLGNQLYAIVWEEDYRWLAVHTWGADWCHKTKSYYAKRVVVVAGRHYKTTMHREILGLERGDKRQGDHVRSGDTLDNRRDRLRICTNTENQQNRRIQVRNTTGFKGVSKRDNLYHAHIRVDGVLKYLGSRRTAQAAHEELYIPAAAHYFKEFSNDGENNCPAA